MIRVRGPSDLQGASHYPRKSNKRRKMDKDAHKTDDKTCIEMVVYRRCLYACLKKKNNSFVASRRQDVKAASYRKIFYLTILVQQQDIV